MTRHDQRSVAEIRRDIERTRERIEERARALEEQIDPGELLNRAVRGVRSSGATDFVNNLGRSVRDHPLALLLTATGITWMIRSEGEHSHDGGNGHMGEHRVRERMGEAKERIGKATSRIRGAAHATRERARSSTRSARAGFDEAADRVRHGWDRMLEEQPLLLGLFGLAAGAAVAASLPPTELEDEMVGGKSDDLKEGAARATREKAEEMREKTSEKLTGSSGAGSTRPAAPASSGAGSTRPAAPGSSGAGSTRPAAPGSSGSGSTRPAAPGSSGSGSTSGRASEPPSGSPPTW